MSLTRFIRTAI